MPNAFLMAVDYWAQRYQTIIASSAAVTATIFAARLSYRAALRSLRELLRKTRRDIAVSKLEKVSELRSIIPLLADFDRRMQEIAARYSPVDDAVAGLEFAQLGQKAHMAQSEVNSAITTLKSEISSIIEKNFVSIELAEKAKKISAAPGWSGATIPTEEDHRVQAMVNPVSANGGFMASLQFWVQQTGADYGRVKAIEFAELFDTYAKELMVEIEEASKVQEAT